MKGREPWSGYQWGILGLLFFSRVFAHMDRVSISVVMPTLIKDFRPTKTEAGWPWAAGFHGAR